MTNDPKLDPLQLLANAAAAVLAQHDPEAARDLARRIDANEQTAVRAGRALSAAVREWLARPQR